MKLNQYMLFLTILLLFISVNGAFAEDFSNQSVDSNSNILVEPISSNDLNPNDSIISNSYYNSGDDGDFDVLLDDSEGSFTDLNNLINSASGSISLSSNYKYNSSIDSRFSSGIKISKNLIIYGNNHTIDGANQAQIFNLVGKYRITINDLTFVNGNSSTFGGAITNDLNNGYNLTVNNCTFINNSAKNFGGAILSYYSFNVNNSKFINNLVYNDTGAKQGGAIYSTFGDVIVNNSIFEGNVANYGGAISSATSVHVYNTSFVNNHARIDGGAIEAYNVVDLINSSCVNNSAINNGGVIFTSSGKINIINSSCVNNSANSFGGIAFAPKEINVINSSCVNNSANDGGVIYSNDNTYIDNSSFYGNKAKYGGVISTIDKWCDLRISNSIFVNNSATYGGSVIHSSWYEISIKNSSFINNSANEGGVFGLNNNIININDSKFTNNHAKNGGVIYSKESSIDIDSSEITNSHAEYGGVIYSEESDISITNSEAIENSAMYEGGVIWGGVSDILLNNSVFNKNEANCSGSVIRGGASNIDGYNCSFNSNALHNLGGEFEGGVIWTTNYANFNNSSFINNTGYNGGAICSLKSNISNCNFINNSGVWGGALTIDKASISNSSFINNSAICGGGAIYVAKANLSNCIFENNSAKIANDILSLASLNLTNTTIQESNVVVYNSTYIFNEDDSSQCIERSIYLGPIYIYLVDECDILNALTGENVSDYLKILVYYYYDDPSFNRYLVQVFTNEYYRNSTNSIILDVIEKYDSGLRIPDKGACRRLENGSTIKFDFFTGFATVYQNVIYYNISYVNPNLIVDKITETPVVFVGNQTSFTIVVTNKGDCDLYGVFVDETYYDGLVYSNFYGENWTKLDNKFIYNNVLKTNESTNFTIFFNTTHSGNFTNIVVAGSDVANNTTANNTTVVYNPCLEVKKITNTPVVFVGNQTSFTIVVTNTGDYDLTNVFIKELSFDDLIYDSWESVIGNWVYSFEDGLHKWTLTNTLSPNETASFSLVFNTSSVGNKTNVIVAGSTETRDVNANNVTEVINKTNPTPNPEPSPNPEPTPNSVAPDKIVNNLPNAGNPLLVLFFTLFVLGCAGLKRKF